MKTALNNAARAPRFLRSILCLVLLSVLAPSILTSDGSAFADSVTTKSLVDEGEGEPRTVRVGFYSFGNYLYKDDSGGYEGFCVDYLDKISRYVNWDFEYVEYPSWSDAFQGLANGEADILPGEFLDESQQGIVLFSDSPLCETSAAMYVRPDDDRYAYEDFTHFEGMTVGVVGRKHDLEVFADYCEANNFSVRVTTYASADDMTAAFERGEIDGISISELGNDCTYKNVARYEPEPMYFALPKGESALRESLDAAMDEILLRDPGYPQKLFKKYLGINTDLDPEFTREEYAYIRSAPTLTVAVDAQRPPLSFVDPETKAYSGASARFFEDVTRITGLQFEFVSTASHVQGLAMAEQGDTDIVYAVDENHEYPNIILTSAYLSDAIAKISGPSPDGDRVALPEGYWPIESLDKDSSSKTVVDYPSPKDCFDAVLSGDVDVAYLDVNVAMALLASPQYESLTISTITNYTNDMSVGVSRHADPILASIFERCVQYTPQEKMNKWISESSLETNTQTLVDTLRRYPLQVLAAVVLLAAAAIAVVVYIMRTKLKSNRRIAKIAYTDPLTGDWNYHRFQIEADSRLQESDGRHYALFYFDFSRFKSFNALFGFAEGDRLLVSVNRLLRDFVHGEECFAHISGDEYVALLYWDGWDGFLGRFEELDKAINQLDIVQRHAYRLLTIGGVCLVEVSQEDGSRSTLSEIIDMARYARESIGGNVSRSTAALYNAEMKERDLAERQLFSKAESALENGEFVAYYQPKVEIETGRIVGLETLARWMSPTGLIQPADFIPLFERNGFVVELDLYMYRLTCQHLRSRLDKGLPVVPVSCNFSRHHLRKSGFPEKLRSIIQHYDVPTHLVELELTENLVMEDIARAAEICKRLKSFGFLISIDDFGSGYSSLGALEDLPIDIVKLDKSLLSGLDAGEREAIILSGIIQIANDLGIKVVMEGIETVGQAELVVSLDHREVKSPGIIAQGFLYSRPVPVEESDAQLDAGTLAPHAE